MDGLTVLGLNDLIIFMLKKYLENFRTLLYSFCAVPVGATFWTKIGDVELVGFVGKGRVMIVAATCVDDLGIVATGSFRDGLGDPP